MPLRPVLTVASLRHFPPAFRWIVTARRLWFGPSLPVNAARCPESATLRRTRCFTATMTAAGGAAPDAVAVYAVCFLGVTVNVQAPVASVVAVPTTAGAAAPRGFASTVTAWPARPAPACVSAPDATALLPKTIFGVGVVRVSTGAGGGGGGGGGGVDLERLHERRGFAVGAREVQPHAQLRLRGGNARERDVRVTRHRDRGCGDQRRAAVVEHRDGPGGGAGAERLEEARVHRQARPALQREVVGRRDARGRRGAGGEERDVGVGDRDRVEMRCVADL